MGGAPAARPNKRALPGHPPDSGRVSAVAGLESPCPCPPPPPAHTVATSRVPRPASDGGRQTTCLGGGPWAAAAAQGLGQTVLPPPASSLGALGGRDQMRGRGGLGDPPRAHALPPVSGGHPNACG